MGSEAREKENGQSQTYPRGLVLPVILILGKTRQILPGDY